MDFDLDNKSDSASSSKSGRVSNTIRRSLSNITSSKSTAIDNNSSKQKATIKKLKSNQRPKSALPLPKSSSNALPRASLIHSTAGDLIPRSNPIPRPPSTPTLRSLSSDDPPQLPPLLPSITLSQDYASESSSATSSPSTSSINTTSSIQSPSTASLSSNETTEDDNSLDIKVFLAAPRLTQRVRLKNGRVVSFSEVGDRNGFPVFVFLGMGCVRYFIAFFDDLASSYGLRLICPDRPGVGLSDDVKVEEQQVLKWPDVIKELCEMLNIDKFFIIAHSAGAPYALACAMKIPERLQGTIYLVCPWVSTTVANNFKWLRFVPTPIMKFTNTAGISLQQMIHGRQPYSTKPSHQRNSGALASPMSSLEKKQQLGLAILKASFAENLSGANNDLLMCFERRHSFGFSYTDINHPVHVFHGTKDERIPVSAVKWMEDNMPDCKLSLIEGGKHSLLLRAEIVDTIFKSIAVQLHVKDECQVCKISSKCWLMEEAENAKKLKEEEERKLKEEEEERLRKQPVENIACT
ncbi:Alpha/Beta hydrolase protein [Glomus cerebriforme]|uniref:Alpha/Beta hydrolase protein n=1 Tax=Glomus cerebriforme TaxID=658196 RepID=A0A397SL25_9GLOM|nr:Alpha/Beta hydrolase protein [Glomus cerebriforme]